MGHTPYGYRIENGKAVIDKEKAQQIRNLYKNYLDGMTRLQRKRLRYSPGTAVKIHYFLTSEIIDKTERLGIQPFNCLDICLEKRKCAYLKIEAHDFFHIIIAPEKYPHFFARYLVRDVVI